MLYTFADLIVKIASNLVLYGIKTAVLHLKVKVIGQGDLVMEVIP